MDCKCDCKNKSCKCGDKCECTGDNCCEKFCCEMASEKKCCPAGGCHGDCKCESCHCHENKCCDKGHSHSETATAH